MNTKISKDNLIPEEINQYDIKNLNIREDVKVGAKTDLEANVQVGEYMAKKYVYPKTGEPTIAEKKEALRKIMKKEQKK